MFVRSRVVPLLFALAAAAQTGDEAYRRMLESKEQVTADLVRQARAITDRAEQEILSVAAWEKQKPRRLEEMRDMLGLLPWPKRTPLNVQIRGTLDEGSYVIEKIAFEACRNSTSRPISTSPKIAGVRRRRWCISAFTPATATDRRSLISGMEFRSRRTAT